MNPTPIPADEKPWCSCGMPCRCETPCGGSCKAHTHESRPWTNH